jgi:hypothetical protein
LLYHLWHGHPPFAELDIHAYHDLIRARFRERKYPADLSLESGIDAIITECWNSEYKGADAILDDMRDLGTKVVPSTPVV